MKERPNESALNRSFEFDALNEAENCRRALLREFAGTLRGRVIEVGSGIGQITERLRQIPAITFLQSIEPDAAFCAEFRKNFQHHRAWIVGQRFQPAFWKERLKVGQCFQPAFWKEPLTIWPRKPIGTESSASTCSNTSATTRRN